MPTPTPTTAPTPRSGGGGKTVAVIASPLEPEHAARIAAAEPDRLELIHRPDLLPPPRFPADHGGDPAWRPTPAQRAEWRALLRRAEILWDFADDRAGPLTLSPGLRWVQATSAGIGPRVEQLGLRGSDVVVTTASGVHAGPLAEFVFAALLFHAKRLAHLQAEQAAHRWHRHAAGELAGQTLAIVGPGRIGRRVAAVGRAFGMAVWAMARDPDPARAAGLGVDRLFARAALPMMLAGADALVLCAPHTPETDGLLGPAAFAALKPGAVLVNIARGALVDEAALVAALRAGRVGFAALDVVRAEPLPPDSPLWDLPNVLISPHSASTVAAENARLVDRFLRNLGCFLDGDLDRMAPILDKDRLY